MCFHQNLFWYYVQEHSTFGCETFHLLTVKYEQSLNIKERNDHPNVQGFLILRCHFHAAQKFNRSSYSYTVWVETTNWKFTKKAEDPGQTCSDTSSNPPMRCTYSWDNATFISEDNLSQKVVIEHINDIKPL